MSESERALLHVCNAPVDEAWVRGYLLPALNLGEGQVHARRDDHPGRPVITEIARATTGCQFTLLVLSQGFLVDEWSEYAASLASHQAVTEGRLLLVARERCELPLHLDFRVRVDLFDDENRDEQMARLRDILGRPEPPDEDIPCPYPGLSPFGAEESLLFFGREAEVEELHSRLTRPAGGRAAQVFLIGPSGSGKSSLLRAGLLPRLARDEDDPRRPQFTVIRVRPGDAPMAALAGALAGALGQTVGLGPAGAVASLLEGAELRRRVLLVVDPLEEIFTLARDSEAERFLAALRELGDQPRCALVALMRADFYPQLMASSIWPIRDERRFDLGPLRGDALRQAIRRPAAVCQVHVEPLLVERLAQEAGHGVGVLPLLQEALVLLWQRRRERGEHRLLTLASYESLTRAEDAGSGRSSGLHVALSRHADHVLADLPDGCETLARRILLRLVHLAEGVPDTRRQQPESALRAAGDDPAQFEDVVGHLVCGRLITLVAAPVAGSERLVDLAHDALIAGWPRLGRWLNELREYEQKRRRLEHRVNEWLRLGAGRGGLLDRHELPAFEAWMDGDAVHRLGVDAHLVAFVAASVAALRRRRRWLAAAVLALVAFSAAVSILALFLIRQRDMTERSLAAAAKVAEDVTIDIEEDLANVAGAAVVRKRLLVRARELVDSLEGLAGERSSTRRARSLTLSQQADLLREQGRLSEALSLYEKAHAYLARQAEQNPENAQWQRDLSISYERLGDAYMATGRLLDALRAVEDGFEIRARLAWRDPHNTRLQSDLSTSYDKLGDVYVASGRLSDALGAFQQGLAISKRLAECTENADLQRDIAISYGKLGNVYVAIGALPEALDAFETGFAISKRLAERHPENTAQQRGLSIACNDLGDVYIATGKPPEALAAFQEGLAISKRLAERYPENTEWQRDLSVSCNKLGDVYVATGVLPDALRSFQDALRIREKLARRDPDNTQWQRDLSISYNNLGDVYVATGELPDALRSFQDGLEIRRLLVEQDPGNAQGQRDLSISHGKLGDVYAATGRHREALRSFRDALVISEKLAERYPENTQWQKDLVRLNLALAKLAKSRREPAEMRQHARSAFEVLVVLDRQDGLREDTELVGFRAALARLQRELDGSQRRQRIGRAGSRNRH